LPVYLKGVLSAAVADRAIQAGCAGVVVSNHGGRQFDAAVPTAVALTEIARIVHKCAPVGGFDVMADSGVRTGTDVCKALALGASSVLVGRQVLYGLARGGRHGVSDVLHRITREFDTALAMTGCRNVADAHQLRAGIFDGPPAWEFTHDAGRLGR
jgi:4-hydroxymandelate oxidase